jgi:FKBP-type peptidyl-prolyl cis-trans isomerase SlyD
MDEIQREKLVTMKYRMTTHFPEGAFEERAEERMSFVYGVETQVPTLEKAIEGRRAGERMSLSIPPSEIYGEHDPALILEIPQKGLIKQRLKQGQFYRQMKMGSLVSFKVLEIRPDTVLVDFNKPMAGIRVNMDIEILDVREATADEILSAAEAQVKRTIGCG